MMKRVAAVLVLLSSAAAAQQSASASLRKMLDEQTAAWNRGDLEGFMQSYWHSPELTFFAGATLLRGWEATLQRYRDKYQRGGREMGRLSFSDESLETLGPDAAVYEARWHLVMPDGKKLEGLTTVVWRHMKDGWKIVHDHSS